MQTPPPLPSPGIDFARFEGTGAGLLTAGFDRKRLDRAQQDAKKWLQQNPAIEIIAIESCFGNSAAFVTIWFRCKQ
jgi:hypothetical protein